MRCFTWLLRVQRPPGYHELRSAPLWPDGPRLNDLEEDERPDLPVVRLNNNADENSCWDFYFTDYEPGWWKGFKDNTNAAFFQWHGTGLYSGLTAAFFNHLAKSEQEMGELTRHDKEEAEKPGSEVGKGKSLKARAMESAVMRGIYTTPDFHKACQDHSQHTHTCVYIRIDG